MGLLTPTRSSQSSPKTTRTAQLSQTEENVPPHQQLRLLSHPPRSRRPLVPQAPSLLQYPLPRQMGTETPQAPPPAVRSWQKSTKYKFRRVFHGRRGTSRPNVGVGEQLNSIHHPTDCSLPSQLSSSNIHNHPSRLINVVFPLNIDGLIRPLSQSQDSTSEWGFLPITNSQGNMQGSRSRIFTVGRNTSVVGGDFIEHSAGYLGQYVYFVQIQLRYRFIAGGEFICLPSDCGV
jgi:hypothetical protein